MTPTAPTPPSSSGPAEQPQACARCTHGCHRCYWTGLHGATAADYDPTRWRAQYDADEIGPKLSWTARHLDAVDHATTTGITADPAGGYRRRPGGRRIAAQLITELTASGFLSPPDAAGRITATDDGRKAALLLHTAGPTALLTTADQAARARRIHRKHQSSSADHKQQLTFPCLPTGDHAHVLADRAAALHREFSRHAAISRAKAEACRARAEAEYTAEQAAERARLDAECEEAARHAVHGCGQCPDTWTVDERCGICRSASHPAPHRPATEEAPVATPAPAAAAPEPEEAEPAFPPAASRPMTAIEGLPHSVTISALNQREDAYAVQCLPCGGGGAFTTVQTIRDGNWSRNNAYMAAQHHAAQHTRRTEDALNTPLWAQQAHALGWSTAQADTVHDAARGHLHYDGTVYYRMDPHDPRATGRTVARARVISLITAGFLECDGRHVTPTDDGTTALQAWHAIRPEPAARETTLLTPLPGGQEDARRVAARAELDAFVAAQLAEERRGRPEQLTLWSIERPAPLPPRPRRPRRAPRRPIAERFPGQTHITVPAYFLPPDIHAALTGQTHPTPARTH
ncbi:hypothetical protein [Streptomyces erythrochromogenes]|uniref:hypothetical protein n=1 Tax=Streptomyces erythrochromogenes TaxID=285574 RepID=UPI003863D629|nr:hypothetical protein OG489_00105 [Streptomyces erythrochromogenes]WSR88345.1 hypothetical protein OG489_39855 [Streptomyces erythrochromogenes]